MAEPVTIAEGSKELVVHLFGADRKVGVFPKRLHTDFRHVVEMLRRGKQARLDQARLTVLEASLAESGGCAPKSLGELRAQVEAWRSEGRTAWDADAYYDSERAAGYTEKMRFPQRELTLRTLQFSSLSEGVGGSQQPITQRPASGGGSLLLVDLGCGSGLSTGVPLRLPGCSLGVIGVDLSLGMLQADSWSEVAEIRSPMAGERLRCDLAQPLPFRADTFDLAYSVATVHYLAQDTQKCSTSQRLDTFLASLKRCLARTAKPCTLQAFFTKDPKAFQHFAEASRRTGWALCDLVVDRPHGASGADRDFLYLVAEAPDRSVLKPPPRCAMHRQTGATCALALQMWAEDQGLPPPQLDDVHQEWLWREHHRCAKRYVRMKDRHAGQLTPDEVALASRLEQLLGQMAVNSDSAENAKFRARMFAELHRDDIEKGDTT